VPRADHGRPGGAGPRGRRGGVGRRGRWHGEQPWRYSAGSALGYAGPSPAAPTLLGRPRCPSRPPRARRSPSCSTCSARSATRHFTPERGILDEGATAEGYRFLTHLLSAGIEQAGRGRPGRAAHSRACLAARGTVLRRPIPTPSTTGRASTARGSVSHSQALWTTRVYTSITVHGADPRAAAWSA
jgi:hypothetical protein